MRMVSKHTTPVSAVKQVCYCMFLLFCLLWQDMPCPQHRSGMYLSIAELNCICKAYNPSNTTIAHACTMIVFSSNFESTDGQHCYVQWGNEEEVKCGYGIHCAPQSHLSR